MRPKIFKARENSPTNIPIEYVLDEVGRPDILPEIRTKGYFDIDFRGSELVVVAGSYIGQIPLNQRITLDVRPKTPIANLIHVVSRASGRIKTIPAFYREYLATEEVEFGSIFEFLARCLCDSLREVAVHGVWKTYQIRSAVGGQLRGKVDFGRSIACFWAKGASGQAVSRYFDYSPEHYVNQMVAYAIYYCLQHFERVGSRDPDIKKELARSFVYFERLVAPRRALRLDLVRRVLQEDKIPSIRGYYRRICEVCLAIIDETAVELQESGEDLELSSFIVNMAGVFEDYVRNVLVENERLKRLGLQVLDGNQRSIQEPLFRDRAGYDTKPDIVVRYGGRALALLEVKYKPKVDENDRYQLISHSLAFGVRHAVFVYPRKKEQAGGLKRLGEVGKNGAVELYEYTFDLHAQDLVAEEVAYAVEVEKLASACLGHIHPVTGLGSIAAKSYANVLCEQSPLR